jgi:hypothetical protein
MIQLSEERNWNEEFEDIVDDPKQNPIVFYGDENVEDLGPAIAEGGTRWEAIERYQLYKRQRDEREHYE